MKAKIRELFDNYGYYEDLKSTGMMHEDYINYATTVILQAIEEQTPIEIMAHSLNKMRKHIRKQCQDELLEKLPDFKTEQYPRGFMEGKDLCDEKTKGFNSCLSQVKKIIEELNAKI